ncbi:MAG: hypothetical protein ACI8ZN_001262, partial [Bacteroidia bacterium]
MSLKKICNEFEFDLEISNVVQQWRIRMKASVQNFRLNAFNINGVSFWYFGD